MKYVSKNGGVLAKELNSFSLEETLECGQCFRANRITEEKYSVIAHQKLLTITESDNGYFFYPTPIKEFEDVWIPYFDLCRDYNEIKETLAANDFVMRDAVEFAPGIRILRQDFFECLISYIISQNSSIPMIKQVIKNISKAFGEPIGEIAGETCYSFPTLEALAKADVSELRACKTGFRDKYIFDACQKLKSSEIAEKALTGLTAAEMREQLMLIKGVGVKVADCVILFSLARYDTFPTDVWVKRIMQHFYFDGKDTPIKTIHELAKSKYGSYAGFAQEYLFYYARQFQIGKMSKK